MTVRGGTMADSRGGNKRWDIAVFAVVLIMSASVTTGMIVVLTSGSAVEESLPVSGKVGVEPVTSPTLPSPALRESIANPLLDPDAMRVEPELLSRPLSDEEKRAMTEELERLQTRHPWELVTVIAEASADSDIPLPVSFMLSIAFVETRGKVLAVSPAGAAGLAQATPAAYLMEGFSGPLYVTNDYLIGTRAFIMKKPLGDAVAIADRVVQGTSTRDEALGLLQKAMELRRVGVEELEALGPRAPEIFIRRVEAADRYNAEILQELHDLLEGGAESPDLISYRDRIRKEYRTLLRVQQETWKRYALSLEEERNRILRDHFGQDHVRVILERPYEAGEVLGEQLDGRFSPSLMAQFLSSHLMTKRQQAIELGIRDDELEQWTAALYNGGLVNVTRMRAGLMPSLDETQNYMHKVPRLRLRLENAIGPARS